MPRKKSKVRRQNNNSSPAPLTSPHASSDQDTPSEHSDLTAVEEVNVTEMEAGGAAIEADAAGIQLPNTQKKRQPKFPPFKVLTDQERADIMEWVQQHPMLYDKACEQYNNKEAKKQLYKHKARELGVEGTDDEPGNRLQVWVKTQRDKVGRLMKTAKGVSGSGSIKMTAENDRFLKRFGWIHQFRNVKNIGTTIVAGLVSTLFY